MNSHNTFHKQRLEIAVQAARLLADDGRLDYLSAKQKALKLCNINSRVDLPTNEEIETQLKIHQKLFDRDGNRQLLLRELRKDAVSVMQKFEMFEPLLVGAVLEGTAVENSPIELHVFSDSVKDVAIFLIEKNIDYESLDRKIRFNKNETIIVPMLRFYIGEREIELSIFEYKMLRHKLISSITQQPMRRANIKKVQHLIS